jgi:CHASE1-domain containing sensor protein
MWNGTLNLVLRGVVGFQWVPLVLNADRFAFVHKTRASGPDFVNFTIRDRGPNKTFVLASQHDEYYVILHSAPLSASIELIGYNIFSSEHEQKEILTSRYQGIDTATSTFDLVEEDKGFLYFSPVYTSSDQHFVGLTCGVFQVASLFNTFKDDNVILIAFDQNVTSSDPTWMIYSTYVEGDIIGYGAAATLTLNQHLNMINSAPYVERRNVHVADRMWQIVYIPKSKFLMEHNGWEKYVGLSASLSGAIFIAILMSAATKWIQYRDKLHRLNLQRGMMFDLLVTI